jgi:hypothetical protein
MTPDEQAMLRALALQVRMLHTDIQDVRLRLGVLENLQSLAERAIRTIHERLFWADVSQAMEEFEDGIPEREKH